MSRQGDDGEALRYTWPASVSRTVALPTLGSSTSSCSTSLPSNLCGCSGQLSAARKKTHFTAEVHTAMSGRARTAVEAAAERRRKHSAQSARIGSHWRGVLVGRSEGQGRGGGSGGAEHGESSRRLRWGRSGTQEESGFVASAARGLSRLGLLHGPRPTMPRDGALPCAHLASEHARGGESAFNSLLQNASSTRRSFSFSYSASPRPSNETPSQLRRIRLPQLTFPRLFPRLPLHPPS
jgi:hypothetical protein